MKLGLAILLAAATAQAVYVDETLTDSDTFVVDFYWSPHYARSDDNYFLEPLPGVWIRRQHQ